MATNTLVEVVMPQMGVSVSEGTVTKWLKKVGEHIAADEALLEISTDKVDTEVPSPGEGIVQEILVQEGETVDVGTRLATIAPDGTAIVAEPASPEPEVAEEAPPPPKRLLPRLPHRSRKKKTTTGSGRSSRPSSPGSPRSTASTRARCPAPATAAE